MKRKVFISGKITGDKNYRKKFNLVAESLTDEGYVVLNPAVLPKGFNCSDYIRICMAMIDAVETVLFLPDWKDSPGARFEMQYAKQTNKDIVFFEDWNGGKT